MAECIGNPQLNFERNLYNRFRDNSFYGRTADGHDHHIQMFLSHKLC